MLTHGLTFSKSATRRTSSQYLLKFVGMASMDGPDLRDLGGILGDVKLEDRRWRWYKGGADGGGGWVRR